MTPPGAHAAACADDCAHDGAAPRGSALASVAGATAAARVFAQIAQFAGFVIAARTLSPAEFGLFALVLVAATLVSCVAEAGWNERVLSFEAERDATHAVAVACGLLGGVAVAAGTFLVGAMLDNADVAMLGALLGACVPMNAWGKVQGARLLADGRAGRAAAVQVAMEGAGLAALAVFLSLGWGVLSLGAAKVVYVGVGFLTALASTRWLSFSRPSRAQLVDMLRFSASLCAARLIYVLQDNLGVVLMGAFLGAHGAGIYRAGARLAGALSEVLGEAIRTVAWTSFRGVRVDGDRPVPATALTSAALGLLTAAMAVGMPTFVGLALVAEDAVAVMFGAEWTGAAIVVALLALRRLVLAPFPAIEPLLALTGGVGEAPRLAMAIAASTVGALLMTAPFGVGWAAFGQFVAGVVVAPYLARILKRRAALSAAELARELRPAAAATLAMAGVVVALSFALADIGAPVRLGAACAAGAATYAIVLFALSKKMRSVAVAAISAAVGRRIPGA